ncbi:MAG: 50S ribosomal L2 [Trebouxia sp. A1-2]|nr:MAG: 50S ribosomal L2 [Trebouxia sp. A1-2]
MLRALLRHWQPLVSLLSAESSTAVPFAKSTLAEEFPVRQALGCIQHGAACLQTTRGKTSAVDVGLKFYKPTTPGKLKICPAAIPASVAGMRGRVITDRRDLWKGGPYKPLTEGIRKTGGRNAQGRITSYHRGGAHKRLYRIIDFKRSITGAEGTLERIEYDPNRTARIALARYPAAEEGGKDRFAYILAPQQMMPGDPIMSGSAAGIRTGNSLPLSAIPVGTALHNVEMHPGRGGQLARSAGTSARLVSKDEKYVVVRLPSGEQRSVLSHCMATVGAVFKSSAQKNVR